MTPSDRAYGWDDRARSAGFDVNGTASVGSIAYWDANSGRGSDGHVAIVEAINGATLTISQDSYSAGPYSWKNITPGTTPNQTPTGYIHVPGMSAYSATSIVAPGDWDGDGFNDVLHLQAAALYLYRGNGAGGFINSGGIVVAASNWAGLHALAPGDWDGDGHPDLLVIDSAGKLWMYRGNGTGGFVSNNGTLLATGWGGLEHVVGPGDWNGDGHSDLIVVDGNGALWAYQGNGVGGFGNGGNGTLLFGSGWSGYPQLAAPGDFDGDGHPDILLGDTNGKLWMYRGNGVGGFVNNSGALVDSGWTVREAVGTPDFSGDGKTDMISVTNSGHMYVYKGNGAGAFSGWLDKGSGW